MMILLLIEYKVIQRMWKLLVFRWVTVRKPDSEALRPGAAREKKDVLDKLQQIKYKRRKL